MKTINLAAWSMVGMLLQVGAGRHAEAASSAEASSFPLIERFESFGIKDGIPSHKVHCVLPASDGRLWVGTYKGLLVREDGKFRKISTEEGLTHQMVLCMVEDPRNGDFWIGTMRGLNRYSGGRITTYTQTSSGLPNNVVYGVDVVGESVWVATAAGLGVMNLKTGAWTLYDHSNTVMHEPWVYSV
jgi:ligand-binding sensor domain-containing protein